MGWKDDQHVLLIDGFDRVNYSLLEFVHSMMNSKK